MRLMSLPRSCLGFGVLQQRDHLRGEIANEQLDLPPPFGIGELRKWNAQHPILEGCQLLDDAELARMRPCIDVEKSALLLRIEVADLEECGNMLGGQRH